MRFLSMVLDISLCGTFFQKERDYYFLNQSSLIWLIPNVCSFPSFCQVGKLVCLTKRTSQKDHDIHNRKCKTRMHSSRIRTTHVLTVSPSMLCAGGVNLVQGVVPGPRGVYLVWGCTWSLGGAPGPGGCTWSRGHLVLGGYLVRYSPPWTESQMPVKT